MQISRNPSQLLIEQYKVAGFDCITPSGCARFVSQLLPQLPHDWQNLNRDSLIKKVRHYCELSVSSGRLKRRRNKETKGYVYEIVG